MYCNIIIKNLLLIIGNRHKKKAEKGNNLDNKKQNLLLSKRKIKRFEKLNKWSIVLVVCY